MNSNDRWMKDGNFSFYEKIKNANIELDFDLDELRRENKKSWFQRLCSCCFTNQKSTEETIPKTKKIELYQQQSQINLLSTSLSSSLSLNNTKVPKVDKEKETEVKNPILEE